MQCVHFYLFPFFAYTNAGGSKQRMIAEDVLRNGMRVPAEVFTFRELANATENFNPELLVGEGGFGRVYKGYLKKTDQVHMHTYIRLKIDFFIRFHIHQCDFLFFFVKVVAVKQLDRNGVQGNREFLAEVLTLSLVHHPNLVNLIGYCADGRQRILVYEYMQNGSLEDHLLGT